MELRTSVGIRPESLKLPPKFQDALFSNSLCFFRRALRSTSHGCVFPFWVRRRRPEGRSRHARRWVLRSSVRAKVWRTASCGRKCQTCWRLWVRNILLGYAYCRLDSGLLFFCRPNVCQFERTYEVRTYSYEYRRYCKWGLCGYGIHVNIDNT